MIISTDKVKLVVALEAMGKSVIEISELLNITRQTVYNLQGQAKKILTAPQIADLTSKFTSVRI